MPNRELTTLDDYKAELEKQKKLVAALLEGKPSGLNIHQASILMDELELENKLFERNKQEMAETIRELAEDLMFASNFTCIWAKNGKSYCDYCPLARLKSAGRQYACGKNKDFSK